MSVSCVVVVWLGHISVVPTTVRQSATPGSKENKRADASTRLFSKVFPADAAHCCEIVRRQSVKVYLVLAYDFLSRCKFSRLTSSPSYSSVRLYAQNPVFEIVKLFIKSV